MAAALPDIEAWIRVVGLAIGATVVLIVPVTGFMKEYWAYRARLREGERLRAETARCLSGPSLGSIIDQADLARATADLAAATRDLAAAVRGRAGRPADQ